jgi:hypothetical protein
MEVLRNNESSPSRQRGLIAGITPVDLAINREKVY